MDDPEAPHRHNLLRKNGKPQSCEPCRRSKLACDHVVPCGRCSRLNRVASCIYDPAPTSGIAKKRKLSGTVQPEQAQVFAAIEIERPPSHRRQASEETPRAPVTYPTINARARTRPPCLPVGLRKRTSVYRPGYMGLTAYGAILNEYGPSLPHHLSEDVNPSSNADVDAIIDASSIELGADILAALPPREQSQKAMLKYFEMTVSSSIHLPTLWHFNETFWISYGSYLEKRDDRESLLACSRLISRRASRKSLPTSFASSREYMDALTDRWEMIGVLFSSFAAMGSMIPQSEDMIGYMLPPGVLRQDFSRSMLESAEACLRLVDQLDTGINVMVAFLSYRCSALQSYIGQRGDTNYSYWRRNVQLCGDMTALGFHRLSEPVLGQPGSILFLEQQKRVFVAAFMHDKHMAVFLGRPPSLSKRYVTTSSLLDASDEALMQDDLAAIKANLNEYGYNKAGILHRATLVKVFYFCSMVYEDILEISLGATPVDYDRVRAAKVQLVEQYQRQPAILHRTVDRHMFQDLTLFESFSAVEIQLINLHQHFLIDRMEHGTEQINFGVAEEMLRIVLVFWNEREAYPGHADDNHWTICCYGIPAASSIAVGLWKASESLGNHSWRNSRSDNIQNLSLFIACLDWIKPVEGNYELCQRTMRMLKDILDRVLAPPAQVVTPAQDFAQLWDLTNFSLAGMPNFGPDVDDLFVSDWMSAPRANFN